MTDSLPHLGMCSVRVVYARGTTTGSRSWGSCEFTVGRTPQHQRTYPTTSTHGRGMQDAPHALQRSSKAHGLTPSHVRTFLGRIILRTNSWPAKCASSHVYRCLSSFSYPFITSQSFDADVHAPPVSSKQSLRSASSELFCASILTVVSENPCRTKLTLDGR